MTADRMFKNFRAITIGAANKGYVHSQVESLRDDNKLKSYTFTID